mgnify:CR=1 FL=1|jgi:hypothetical protein
MESKFHPTEYVLKVCRRGLDLSEGMSALLDLDDVGTSLSALFSGLRFAAN